MTSLVLALLLAAPQSQVDRLCSGGGPHVSPDGRWVALWRPIVSDPFGRRGPEYNFEIWVRDLKSGEEKRLNDDGLISSWVDHTTLMLRGGKAVSPTGAPSRVAEAPEKFSAVNVAWAPGGKRIALVPRLNWLDRDPLRFKQLLILDDDGKRTRIDLGHSLFSEDPGLVAWSPDGKRLAFHQLFFRYGNLPVRRVGVVDVANGAVRYIAEGNRSGSPGREYGEWSGDARGTWDDKGDRFVFITGRGGGESDVHVASADGGEVLQLTDDEDSKWSAVLDPAGRRVAFCAGRAKQDRDLVRGRIRILDLYTGRETEVEPTREGTPRRAAWLPDGSGLVFDCDALPEDFRGSEKHLSLYRVLLPKPDPLPAGAKIKFKPALSRTERIHKALESDNEGVVEWAAEELRNPADREFIPALRKALGRATQRARIGAERELLDTLEFLDARDAAPEIIGTIRSTYEANQSRALGLVGRWQLKQATDEVLKKLESTPETEANVHAAGALAWLSHESGWRTLQKYLRSGEKGMRGAVAASLCGLADPKAVPLLIALVDDVDVLYHSGEGGHQVGDEAERALATITGKTFDRKPADWLAWWARQDGGLPAVPSPNPALKKLDEDLKRREREWQEIIPR